MHGIADLARKRLAAFRAETGCTDAELATVFGMPIHRIRAFDAGGAGVIYAQPILDRLNHKTRPATLDALYRLRLKNATDEKEEAMNDEKKKREPSTDEVLVIAGLRRLKQRMSWDQVAAALSPYLPKPLKGKALPVICAPSSVGTMSAKRAAELLRAIDAVEGGQAQDLDDTGHDGLDAEEPGLPAAECKPAGPKAEQQPEAAPGNPGRREIALDFLLREVGIGLDDLQALRGPIHKLIAARRLGARIVIKIEPTTFMVAPQ